MGAWIDRGTVSLLEEAIGLLQEGFSRLPEPGGTPPGAARMREVLRETALRLADNYPYGHPLYAGQMLKPPHPVARLAYALAMHINPNNHALDGGRASSAMEKEAVAALAGMFGWEGHLGHLCSGGTMANLEGLWAAGRLHPGNVILASEQAHYTHERLCGVLGLPFEKVACDAAGRMDLAALEARLKEGGAGAIVATAGTTLLGAVDPIDRIAPLAARHGVRLHVDAAYGGYFTLASSLRPPARAALDRLGRADSIVIDPHKHGLQPYGCGCIIFRDPGVGRLYAHESPYTYFTSKELHLGEITLECSRPGAAAVALWATQRLLPLERGGEFARDLDLSLEAARELHTRLEADGRFTAPVSPELDIVVWAPLAKRASEASDLSRRIFDEAARRDLHLALAAVPLSIVDPRGTTFEPDRPAVTCLRSVLMKPGHASWLDRIVEILDEAAAAAGLPRGRG